MKLNTKAKINSLKLLFKHPLNTKKKTYTFLKVIFWKFNQKFLKFSIIIPFTKNYEYICNPVSDYAGMIFYMKYPDYFEFKFLEKALKKKSTFIDIGAGFGDYSLLAAEILSSENSKIFSFEPADLPFIGFSKNIVLNKLENKISLMKEIISDSVGYLYFHEEKTSEISHISHKKLGKKRQTTTIDSMVKKYKLREIDLIKIDVEGAEKMVLDGAKLSLKRGIIKNIILELNAKNKDFTTSHEQIIEYLNKFSYSVYKIENYKLMRHPNFDEKQTFNVICIHETADTSIQRFVKKSLI